MRYFTSDLHFGHRAILSYCGRPWPDVESMNEGILARLNAWLRPDDELWVLGDIAFGPLDENLPLVERIGCPVTIVAGNHDRCHPAMGSKHLKQLDRYASLSNVVAVHLGTVELTLDGRLPVQVCHFPYHGDHTAEERYSEYRPVDDGRWLIHGHVHDMWAVRGRQINVGIDAGNGYPYSEDSLAGIIRHRITPLPAVPWS